MCSAFEHTIIVAELRAVVSRQCVADVGWKLVETLLGLSLNNRRGDDIEFLRHGIWTGQG